MTNLETASGINVETRPPSLKLQPFLKEGTKQISLASDHETLEYLRKQGIKAHLWEDCYIYRDLKYLHTVFNAYCQNWFYDSDSKDVSLYDGLSFGKATSFYFYADLETWIRIFILFEAIAAGGIECTLFLSDKNYFPLEFSGFIETLNSRYDGKISLKETGVNFKGRNPSVSDVLAWERAIRYFTKFRKLPSLALSINKLFRKHHPPAKDLRCFIVQMRDKEEYLTSLFKSVLRKRISLYYSRYFFPPSLAPHFIKNDIRIFDDFNYTPTEEVRAKSKLFLRQIETFLEKQLIGFEILQEEGRRYFNGIFKAYVKKSFENQVRFYDYLDFYFQKYKITRTICGGHRSFESYFCAHLMRKLGGLSFYLPHGFSSKEPQNAYKRYLADYFFVYSGVERKQWRETYSIPDDRLLPVSFSGAYRKKDFSEKYRIKNPLSSRILILGETFHHSLNCKINSFHFTGELCALLRRIGFEDATVRLHSAFSHYTREGLKSVEEDFFGYKLQDSRDIPLKRIISDFHLVIGQHSTVIYDAICADIIYLSLIRNFLAENYNFWFPGLFPNVCTELPQLKEILEGYIKSPFEFYRKYKKSIDKLEIYENPKLSLWKNIVQKN